MRSRWRILVMMFLGVISGAEAQDRHEELVKRGEYLARAGDCIACHTAPEGRIFAGGRHVNAIWHVVYLQYHAGPGHRHR